MGRFLGVYVTVWRAEERWQVLRLGERDIVVATPAGSCQGACEHQARRTMERYGAYGFVKPG